MFLHVTHSPLLTSVGAGRLVLHPNTGWEALELTMGQGDTFLLLCGKPKPDLWDLSAPVKLPVKLGPDPNQIF